MIKSKMHDHCYICGSNEKITICDKCDNPICKNCGGWYLYVYWFCKNCEKEVENAK